MWHLVRVHAFGTFVIPIAMVLALALVLWTGSVAAQSQDDRRDIPSVQLPDLVISGLSNPPTNVIAGQGFSVTDTTTNIGIESAVPSTTGYFLSDGTTIDSGDPLIGKRSVSTLNAGKSSTGSAAVTIPLTTTTGVYFVVACADALHNVHESNENNNCRSSTTQVRVLTAATATPTRTSTATTTVTATATPTASATRTTTPTVTPTPTDLVWTTVAPMLTARTQLGVAQTSDGKIYAVGGNNATTALAAVERYDPSTNTWTAVTSLPTGRYALGVVTGQDGLIYALGGALDASNSAIWSQEVDQYNPATDTWTRKSDLPIPIAAYGALGGDGVIYLYGNAGCVSYNPQTDTSQICPTGGFVGGGNGAAVAIAPGGAIELLGHSGCPASTANIQFDPFDASYTAKAPMPIARDYLSAALGSNGLIYVVGGTPGCGAATNTVQEYNPVTDSWQLRASLTTPRANPGVVGSSDQKLYVIGGNNGGSYYASVEVAALP
jgi:hypothetical protein